MRDDLDQVVARLQRLEALRACPGASAGERANADAAIKDILRRKGLSEADVFKAQPDRAETQHVVIDESKTSRWRASLLDGLAQLQDCRAMRSDSGTYVLLGDKDKVTKVHSRWSMMCTEVDVHSLLAWDARIIRFGDGEIGKESAWRDSFGNGASSAVRQRIANIGARASQTPEPGQSASPESSISDISAVLDELRDNSDQGLTPPEPRESRDSQAKTRRDLDNPLGFSAGFQFGSSLDLQFAVSN